MKWRWYASSNDGKGQRRNPKRCAIQFWPFGPVKILSNATWSKDQVLQSLSLASEEPYWSSEEPVDTHQHRIRTNHNAQHECVTNLTHFLLCTLLVCLCLAVILCTNIETHWIDKAEHRNTEIMLFSTTDLSCTVMGLTEFAGCKTLRNSIWNDLDIASSNWISPGYNET